jgi:ribonuclease P protein component
VNRSHRLRRPDQFQRVRHQGRTVSHHLLRLNVATNHGKRVRCGFVVGKRVGKAVVRNRAKRRVREIVRLMLPSLQPNVDLVFVVRSPEVATEDFVILREVVEQLLHRAGVWDQQDDQQDQPIRQSDTEAPMD